MSTKITIKSEKSFHLYEDAIDDTIWLEMRGTPFSASDSGVSVLLSPKVLTAIRSAADIAFPHLRGKK